MTIQTSDNKFGVAKWIVDPIAGKGTHTTISAALTSASAGDTIFVRPGNYTEDLTLKADVNIVSFPIYSTTVSTGQASITGKCSASFTGRAGISGLNLISNADFAVSITSSNSTLLINNCSFRSTNASMIECTAGSIEIYNSRYFKSGTGAEFAISGGFVELFNVIGDTDSRGTAASTISAGTLEAQYSIFTRPITTSSTGALGLQWCQVFPSGNTTAVTCGGSGAHLLQHCRFSSGSAASLAINTTVTLLNSTIISNAANAITGSGTINYAGLTFSGTGSNITTTTQNPVAMGPAAKVSSANSGGTNTFTAENTSNTGSSSTNVISKVAGTSAGDAMHQSLITGSTTWTWGLDNSAADAFVISASGALGTTDIMQAQTTGEINYPLQPNSFATASAQNNVTGNNETYTVIFANEVFDIGGNYNNTTGVYTAPVTGEYQINAHIQLGDVGAAHTAGFMQFVASNRTVIVDRNSPAAVRNSNNAMIYNGSMLLDLDAADTIRVQTVVANGTTVIDVQSGSFSVNLAA